MNYFGFYPLLLTLIYFSGLIWLIKDRIKNQKNKYYDKHFVKGLIIINFIAVLISSWFTYLTFYNLWT